MARVLVYHLIQDRSGFLRQLDWLTRLRPVQADAVLREDGVCISFDDGWNDLPWAFEMIKQRGLRAVLFLTTMLPELRASGNYRAFVQRAFPRLSARTDPVPVSWDELRQLVGEGLVIGAHTHTHTRVGPGLDFHREMMLPQQLIAENLGLDARLFAFPYGRRRDIHLAWVPVLKQAGYTMAFIGHGWRITANTHHMLVPRHPVLSYDVKEVKDIINGKRDLRERLSWWVQSGLVWWKQRT